MRRLLSGCGETGKRLLEGVSVLSVGIAIASSGSLQAVAQSPPPDDIPPEAPEIIEQTIPRPEPLVPPPEPPPLPEPSLQTPVLPAEDVVPESTALPFNQFRFLNVWHRSIAPFKL